MPNLIKSQNIMVYSKKSSLAKFSQNIQYSYLTEEELNRLIFAYQDYLEQAKGLKKYKNRWRQFIIFMTLRETGARIGEVLMIDDTKDIDFKDNSILIRTLKQKKDKFRTVFISDKLIAEISRFLLSYSEEKGKVYKLGKKTVQDYFLKMCSLAGLDRSKSHVHILRHTRAIELLKNGVPLHHVRMLLGHSSILTTSAYLNVYQSELKQVLIERNLI